MARYPWSSILAFHLAQGEGRSLRKSCTKYAEIVERSPSISAWRLTSARDLWQEQASEYDGRQRARSITVLLDSAEEMDRTHAALSQQMGDLSADALSLLAKRPGKLTSEEARHLGEQSIKLGRLVSGQSTTRTEVTLSWAEFTQTVIVTLFLRAAHAAMNAGALEWDSAPIGALRWEFSAGLSAAMSEHFRGMGEAVPEYVVGGEDIDINAPEFLPVHVKVEELSDQPDYLSGSAGIPAAASSGGE